jgi:two-component system phosphate regulon response regulator PhoB
MNGRRVLLVEDDPILQRAADASLRQRGFDVLMASDGEEGLRIAREQCPDLVLLDLLMPLMPGLKLLRSLKAEEATRHIPVLILSNSSRDDDNREAISLGAAGYLVKANVSLKELGDHVERLLRAP